MENQFVKTLEGLHEGHALRELEDALRATVQAIRIVGKPGSLTLKLTITPIVKSNTEACQVAYKIDSNQPVIDPQPVFFFVTEDNELTAARPNAPQRLIPGTE